MTIVLRLTGTTVVAELKEETNFWGCGNSSREAIGSLIRAHPEKFGVEIEDTFCHLD